MKKLHAPEKRIASVLEITPRYVRDLFANHRVSPGIYDYDECFKTIYLMSSERDEEFKLQKIKTETAQFKLDVLKKEYHKTEDIELYFADLVARIKSKVTAIPNKGARLVAGETDIAKAEAILKEFTDDILNELANTQTLEAIGDADGTEDEDII